VVLGCIAEKLAGPSSISILTQGTLSYLITNLVILDFIYFILWTEFVKFACLVMCYEGKIVSLEVNTWYGSEVKPVVP
jgi:hypothetical protein